MYGVMYINDGWYFKNMCSISKPLSQNICKNRKIYVIDDFLSKEKANVDKLTSVTIGIVCHTNQKIEETEEKNWFF